MKLRRKLKIGLLTLITIIIVAMAGGAAYLHFNSYQPSSAANVAVKSAQVTNQVTTFKSHGKSKMTVVFYPGAMVTPNSYAIWAKQVAAAGYTVKIVHFPLNMAFFKLKAADSVLSKNEQYVVGGHSLGGAMAARYAHQSTNRHLKGVFFLTAYADEKGRLDSKNYPALSITASRDGVLNWNHYNHDRQYLPKQTTYVTIKGGNHGGFGSYGCQKGDQSATISNQQQQKLVARNIIAWLAKIK